MMTPGAPSNTRIGRLHEVMASHVRRGAVPGLVTLVSRDDLRDR